MNRVKLGDILRIKHGYAFKSEDYVEKSPYALVTLANISNSNNFQFAPEKTTYYGAVFPEEFKLYENDLIMPLTEQVVGLFGNSAFVPKIKGIQFVLNQRVGKVIPKDDKADKYYLHYLLSTDTVREQLEYRASGTRQRNISPDDVYDVTVFIPDIEIQRKIGKMLYGLERKINLNSKINDNIHHQLKLIYNYWFTQFDFPDENGKPYRSSGGKMVWNEQLKRDIPKGWQVANLYSIGDYVNGLACQKHRPKDNFHKIPVIKITEMHNGIADNTEFVRDDISDKYIINDGDILFSWSATLETMIWYGGKGGLNQHIFKVVPKCPKYYVYAQLSNYIINFKTIAEARKTTMGHITTDHIEQSKIANPPLSIQEKFNNKVSSLYDKIAINCKQNVILSNLRDWLLPMLMNGQVSIMDEHEEKPQIKVSGFEQWLANQGFAARGDVDIDVLRDIYEAMDSDDK